jgi:hypothetical protein
MKFVAPICSNGRYGSRPACLYSKITGASSVCGNLAFCIKDYHLLSEVMKRPEDSVGLGPRALREYVN